MSFWDFMKSKESKMKPYSKEAEGAWKQLLEGGITEDELYNLGGDYLKNLFSGDFSAFEQPLIDQFEQQIVPGIAERFAGMGAGSSSGLNLALAEASKGLSTQLGAQKAGLMQNLLPQTLQYAQAPYQNMVQGLQNPPFYQRQGSKGFLERMLEQLATSGMNAATGGAGGGGY